LASVKDGSEHADLTPELPRIGSTQEGGERRSFGFIDECDCHQQWETDAQLKASPSRDGESFDQGNSQSPNDEMTI
jgi:hypothetical protein